MRILLLLLALLIQPAPPTIDAQWVGGEARIRWEAEGWACLYRTTQGGSTYFLGCWERGGVVILPGEPPQDLIYHPAAGDTYCVRVGEGEACAPLVWRVWLALVGS